MNIKTFLCGSALLLSSYGAVAQTAVIAHRGYWKTDGAAQNSIAALVKADSIGCYGSEFDVWLAADGQLVVNHDPTYQTQSMENSPSTLLTTLKLDNGERLPTLAKYLRTAKPLNTRLMIFSQRLCVFFIQNFGNSLCFSIIPTRRLHTQCILSLGSN